MRIVHALRPPAEGQDPSEIRNACSMVATSLSETAQQSKNTSSRVSVVATTKEKSFSQGVTGFVPREIPGENLKDRIDEYHRRNPNQLARGTLSSNTTLLGVLVPEPTPVPIPSPTDIFQSCQLNAQDRIQALEQELYNLRVRQPNFQPTIRTRTQRAAERSQAQEREVIAPTVIRATEPARIEEIPDEPVRRRSPAPSTIIPEPVVISDDVTRLSVPAMPEHLYRTAGDATYAPKRRVVPARPPNSTAKKPEPAFRKISAIRDPAIAEKVYNRALDTPLTITYHELLSLSPEVRSQVRDAVSSKRISKEEAAKGVLLKEEALTEEELSYLFPDEEVVSVDDEPDPESVMAFFAETLKQLHLPSDTIVTEDPIDRYYRTLPAGEVPNFDCLIVAKESSALRSIVPLVDNQLKVESILDPGCQIIAMSEDCCHALALPYDPSDYYHQHAVGKRYSRSLVGIIAERSVFYWASLLYAGPYHSQPRI
jgi:hypothetical protein